MMPMAMGAFAFDPHQLDETGSEVSNSPVIAEDYSTDDSSEMERDLRTEDVLQRYEGSENDESGDADGFPLNWVLPQHVAKAFFSEQEYISA